MKRMYLAIMLHSRIGLVSVALFVLSCSGDSEKQFTLLGADDTGVGFVNENNETEQVNIFTYEYLYNGGGVAIGDINNDGLRDLYFTSNSGENRLYLNKGNLEFEDITAPSGTACPKGWKTGVTMADVNADGWLDIYVSRSALGDPELRRNILLINNGDLTFIDRAAQFALDDDSYSTQASFFDYDRDGDLDVILLNHSLLQVSNSFDISLRNTDARFPLVGNKLLRNDRGVFLDVSDSVGIFGPASNYGLGLSLSDINNDGWIDVYAGCDYTGRDRALLNFEGSFYDATDSLFSHISKFTMGTDIADINGDGLMDICTLDMLPEDNRRQKQLMGSDRYDAYNEMVRNGLHSQYMRNMLHLNNGDGTFSEIGQLAGISNTDWSWAPLFADFDNDGVMDLFVSNGFKRDLTDNDFAKFKAFQEIVAARRQGKNTSFLEVISRFTENKISNYAYRGRGDLTFDNVTRDWGFDQPTLTNGVAYGDLDNDGDLDIVTNNVNEHAGIYRNNANHAGMHFLQVQLIDAGNNTFAVGANVTAVTKRQRIVREQLPSRGFQSSVDMVLHFGLGAATTVDTLLVQWPSGETRVLTDVRADQKIALRPQDGNQLKSTVHSSPTLFRQIKGPVFRHRENDFIDFRIQALLPRMYSTLGPALAIADVNGDGLRDVFVGGARDQKGELFIRKANGEYRASRQPAIGQHQRSEDIDAAFFDMDGDGDQDLLVGSGGYEYSIDDAALRDRLYENDGRGNFLEGELPEYLVSTSCIRPADVDGDGDIDVFIGGRIVPGRYPESPSSYILINQGNGRFVLDENHSWLQSLGMVTDAAWVDLNSDGQQDLVVAGEWMPLRVFINDGGRLTDWSAEWVGAGTEGLWNRILARDFDRDGDVDLVVSNIGLNTQMRVRPDVPATLVYDDFDKNGSVDPILNYLVMDQSYPYPTRDELMDQVPMFKKRFTTYSSYSSATIDQVLTAEELSAAKTLEARELRGCYFSNDGGRFSMKPMPMQFQFAPIFAMGAMDVDGDGLEDIVTGGNLSATRARTGKLTGNTGFIFRNIGNGEFHFVPAQRTGLRLCEDVRQIIRDNDRLIIGLNDAALRVFELTPPMPLTMK